jgi:hypothetical protein
MTGFAVTPLGTRSRVWFAHTLHLGSPWGSLLPIYHLAVWLGRSLLGAIRLARGQRVLARPLSCNHHLHAATSSNRLWRLHGSSGWLFSCLFGATGPGGHPCPSAQRLYGSRGGHGRCDGLVRPVLGFGTPFRVPFWVGLGVLLGVPSVCLGLGLALPGALWAGRLATGPGGPLFGPWRPHFGGRRTPFLGLGTPFWGYPVATPSGRLGTDFICKKMLTKGVEGT